MLMRVAVLVVWIGMRIWLRSGWRRDSGLERVEVIEDIPVEQGAAGAGRSQPTVPSGYYCTSCTLCEYRTRTTRDGSQGAVIYEFLQYCMKIVQ
jgi:hypothetical protein